MAPTAKMKRRMFFIMLGLFLVGFSAVIIKLVDLQIINSEFYQQKALNQQMRETSITASRGTIYDRNMKVLAQSASAWTVFISPAEIESDEQAQQIAKGLADILDLDESKIYEQTQKKGSYYEVIKRKVELEVADEIRQFSVDNEIKAIYLGEDSKRYYPYGNFASTVLGFVGDDNQGLAGLEAYYDDVLSGTEGKIVSAKNAWGTDMPYGYEQIYEAQNGNSLVLTIDEVVQHYLEKNLEIAVEQYSVTARGVGIVMEVETGEILAMATKNDFDPNDPFTIYDEAAQERLEGLTGEEYAQQLSIEQNAQWRNKAVSDPYEPGSVFKIITAAAGIEEKVVTRYTPYYCSGYAEVAGTKISCWKTGGHGAQMFEDALKNSCNPFFMYVGASLGAERFFSYFEAFGLTEKTGIDLPGEAGNSGLYHTLSNLGPVQLASSSFGQTFKVTPIQLMTAVCAVLNDGILIQPKLVSQIIDENNNIIESYDTIIKRQVISKSTSEEIASLLERVITADGKNAQVMGYRVGGKSGTSEKLDVFDEEGNQNERIASFFGFAPVDDPKIAVLIILDEPHAETTYGSVLAAPVVASVLAEVLPYMGIEPSYSEEELQYLDVTVPPVEGMVLTAAEQKLTQANLNYLVKGKGSTVVRQFPSGNTAAPNGGTVILFTEEDMQDTNVPIPNVIGYTASQANKTFANLNLNVRFTGAVGQSGVTVYSQSMMPEDGPVPQGTVITLELRGQDEAIW